MTCSKLTTETLEQGATYANVHNKDTSTTHFTPCSIVSIVNSDQVNTGWVQLAKAHIKLN